MSEATAQRIAAAARQPIEAPRGAARALAEAFLSGCTRGSRALPESLAERVAGLIGDGRRALNPSETAAVRLNLSRLGLHTRESLARETFRAHGLFVLEFLRGLRMEPADIVRAWEIEGHAHFARLARRPDGFILAGAHTGNWEQISALSTLSGRAIAAPAATQLHPLLSPGIGAWKRARGVRTFAPETSPRRLLRALGEGALIGLPLDGGSFHRGRLVRLRGARVRLASGAAHLALLSGCPVLPVLGLRTGFMRQRVRIDEPLRAADFAGPPAVRLQALAQALADILGDHLGAAAGQWCIFRPLAWYHEGTSDPITQGDAS